MQWLLYVAVALVVGIVILAMVYVSAVEGGEEVDDVEGQGEDSD